MYVNLWTFSGKIKKGENMEVMKFGVWEEFEGP